MNRLSIQNTQKAYTYNVDRNADNRAMRANMERGHPGGWGGAQRDMAGSVRLLQLNIEHCIK